MSNITDMAVLCNTFLKVLLKVGPTKEIGYNQLKCAAHLKIELLNEIVDSIEDEGLKADILNTLKQFHDYFLCLCRISHNI